MEDIKKLKRSYEALLWELAGQDFDKVMNIGDAGMFHGYTGLSLFFYQLYCYFSREEHLGKALSFFEKAYNHLPPQNFNLSSGSAGTMWLMNYYLQQGVVGDDAEEILTAYDKILSRRMDAYEHRLDPMHGLLSLTNYFFSRNNAQSVQSLTRILDHIDAAKIVMEKGIAWEHGYDDPRIGMSRHINFGYAHGILNMLYVLSRYLRWGMEVDRCSELFKKGMDFFLSWRNAHLRQQFPSRIEKGIPKGNMRVAYCYGDLGLACGLTAIARNLEDDKIMRYGREVALSIASVALEDIHLVEDIGLCHGAAGNGYIFMKLYKHHGCEILWRAAVAQYGKLLTLKKEGEGIAGFTSVDFDDERLEFYRRTDPGFINGVAGMGLSIIGLLSDDAEGQWDKILHLS